MVEILSEMFFPLYLTSTSFNFAIYSILHFILLYPLVLLHSQRLTKLYDIRTYDSTILSVAQIRQYISPLSKFD